MRKLRSLILLTTLILIMTCSALVPANAETQTELWEIIENTIPNIQNGSMGYYQYGFTNLTLSKQDNFEIILKKADNTISYQNLWEKSDYEIYYNNINIIANENRITYYNQESIKKLNINLKNNLLIFSNANAKEYSFNIKKESSFKVTNFISNLKDIASKSTVDIIISIECINFSINDEEIKNINITIPPNKFWNKVTETYKDNNNILDLINSTTENIDVNNIEYYQYDISKIIIPKDDDILTLLNYKQNSIWQQPNIPEKLIIKNLNIEDSNQQFKINLNYDLILDTKKREIVFKKKENTPFLFNMQKINNLNQNDYYNIVDRALSNINNNSTVNDYIINIYLKENSFNDINVIQIGISSKKFWEINKTYYIDNEQKTETENPTPKPDNSKPDKPLNNIEKIIVIIAILPFIAVMIAIFLSVSSLTIFVSKKIKNKKQKEQKNDKTKH